MQNEELQQRQGRDGGGAGEVQRPLRFRPGGLLDPRPRGDDPEANLTGASLLGIERSRLVKRRFGLFVSAADRPAFNAFLAKVFESKAREFCEVTLLQEGKPPVEVRIEAVAAASGKECRAVLEDITERKRAEADRLILNKLESTGILAGGMAHDFNNLLTVILLNLELAQTRTPSAGELARLLEEAKKAALMARGLTQQLITFATGGAPVRKPTALSGVIQESVRPALSGSRVRCEFSLAEDLWLAEVDAGQIGQVIRNLVLNAREAMPRAEWSPSGRRMWCWDPTNTLPAAGGLRPGEHRRPGRGHCPERCCRRSLIPISRRSRRGDQKGMGLGLTICHAVIQKHGGAIAVESEGAGNTFDLHLPASGGARRDRRHRELFCHGPGRSW